jgi:hypothetical protein
MDADDSIELGPTAPALEIPWEDTEGRLQFVDLRSEPDSVDRIPEAREFAALRRFLIDLNSKRRAWQTAKCDVWAEAVEASENLYSATHTQGGYVDIVLAESQAAWRGSLEYHQRVAREVAALLGADEALEASAEIVVRRCYFHRGGARDESDAGYCLTQFLTGYGTSEAGAAESWERAMEFAARCWLELPVGEPPGESSRTQLK